MEHSQNGYGAIIRSIGNHERRARDDEFARTPYPAWSSHVGVLQQSRDLLDDFVAHMTGRSRAVMGNVLDKPYEIANRARPPVNPHDAKCPPRSGR
jgi:hypothetical protein